MATALVPFDPKYVKATKTSLTLTKGMPFKDYNSVCNAVEDFREAGDIWLGDAIAFGLEEYGDDFWQAKFLERLDETTVENLRRVAIRVPKGNRVKGTMYAHWRAVASLPAEEQKPLLQDCVDKEWGERELRRQVKLHKKIKKMKAAAKAPLESDQWRLLRGSIAPNDPAFVGAQIPDETIDLIFTDPKATPDNVNSVEDAARLAARVLKAGGSMLIYCDQPAVAEAIRVAVAHLPFNWILEVPHKPEDLKRYNVKQTWRPLLWFMKPGDFITAAVADSLTFEEEEPGKGKGKKKDAKAAKRGSVAEQVIKRFTVAGDFVLDPFMNEGAHVLAAVKLERKAVGLDEAKRSIETVQKLLTLQVGTLPEPEADATDGGAPADGEAEPGDEAGGDAGGGRKRSRKAAGDGAAKTEF